MEVKSLKIMAPELTEVKHKCDICLQILKNADGLRRHQKNVHGEKKFVCEHCKKRFTNQGDLKKTFDHTFRRPAF